MHGYQHTAGNLVVGGPACNALLVAQLTLTASAFGAGILFGTLLVTPDLDLHQNDTRRRWGALRFVWGPYASLSRHRGRSHTYLLGPLVRLAYLAAWMAPLCLITHRLLPSAAAQWTANGTPLRMLVISIFGYFAAQWLHLLCDGILPFQSTSTNRKDR